MNYMIVAHLWFYFPFIFPSYIFVQIWYPLKASKETKINGQKDTAKWNQEVFNSKILGTWMPFSQCNISDYQKNHSTVLSC